MANSSAQRPDDRFRAPHILCLRFPNSALGEVIAKLTHEQIYVTPRIGRMRISPPVYNDESNVDRFVTTVTRRCVPSDGVAR